MDPAVNPHLRTFAVARTACLALATLFFAGGAHALCLDAPPDRPAPPEGRGATPLESRSPAATSAPRPGAPLTVEPALLERALIHPVVRGDSLVSIGARYGVTPRLIAAATGLDVRVPLRVGEPLQITTRHIVAPALADGLVLNLPQRLITLHRGGHVEAGYPVAVGRADWPTPTGEFTVLTRETDKTWYVPKSIQEEMRREGRPVLTQVPPGPSNPLGRHWIGLSLPSIGIHGTNAPASIYGFRSHGCIRMHPDDVADLFGRVAIGDRGRIIYQPVQLARDAQGRVWFEANPDAYRRGAGTLETVRALARALDVGDGDIVWSLVESMLQERDGLAREVGRRPQ